MSHPSWRSQYESWIEPHKLGSIISPNLPAYPFDGFINENHARFASCPVRDEILVDFGIPGWLRREDALKLYELAYYSPGDVLELDISRPVGGDHLDCPRGRG